jgi:pimeloyl-ACP methyl ester carboxylesterase
VQEFADATAKLPLLHELGVEGARKLIQDPGLDCGDRADHPRAAAGPGHRLTARERDCERRATLVSTPTPTIVLVHGTFADSSSWNGVVDKLQSHDNPVVAAGNPLRGLTSDADYVRQLVASIDGPVVLIGHSYGGSVISTAAKGADNVKALVFVAAFLPETGESAITLLGKFPGSRLGGSAAPGGGDAARRQRGSGSLRRAEQVPQTVRRRCPGPDRGSHGRHPAAGDRRRARGGAGAPAWRDIPSWALVASEDRNIPSQT